MELSEIIPTVTSDGFVLFFLFGLSKVYGSTKHFFFLRDGIETRYVLFGTERIEKQVTE